jgi:NAD(P) transhydrogenase subunit beta
MASSAWRLPFWRRSFGPGSGLWLISLVLIAGGAAVGYQLATRVEMTQMPELVAIMHSLVGLAAVFVGFNADLMINTVAAVYEAQGLVLGAVGADGMTAIGLAEGGL